MSKQIFKGDMQFRLNKINTSEYGTIDKEANKEYFTFVGIIPNFGNISVSLTVSGDKDDMAKVRKVLKAHGRNDVVGVKFTKIQMQTSLFAYVPKETEANNGGPSEEAHKKGLGDSLDEEDDKE